MRQVSRYCCRCTRTTPQTENGSERVCNHCGNRTQAIECQVNLTGLRLVPRLYKSN